MQRKLVAPPIADLETIAAVDAFLSEHRHATVVLGFFRERDSDEYREWSESAAEISRRAGIYLGNVAPALHSK